MLGKLWWRVAGLMLLLGVSGGMLVLLYNAILQMASPLMGPICPGAPPCA